KAPAAASSWFLRDRKDRIRQRGGGPTGSDAPADLPRTSAAGGGRGSKLGAGAHPSAGKALRNGYTLSLRKISQAPILPVSDPCVEELAWPKAVREKAVPSGARRPRRR